ncbi:Hypothetical protein I596_3163 [Dokdonella koreensis DS-123]|uniref:Uncharacterized protein n=1 Tax=Dokdonella koreensis DS-123 TaxID=1300342 RepID=A0A160DYL2_9GAMM|nr:Hypothetical protein I596_3163 [Dokdonella koreensis DS-123]
MSESRWVCRTVRRRQGGRPIGSTRSLGPRLPNLHSRFIRGPFAGRE